MELNIRKTFIIAAILPWCSISDYYEKLSKSIQELTTKVVMILMTKPLISCLIVLISACFLTIPIFISFTLLAIVFGIIVIIIVVEGVIVFVILIATVQGILIYVLIISLVSYAI
ncbi:PREDICTED: uncharacterized protein LOC106128313 [Papilio xuthus]|uniref:Uncharacterized protein LOC106128313 n=1 Tax=Papilio xuthus TaxID=66420 RepID=A0AAJ7ELB5_PAPXU|nr:PREDICTED: uncharacterized protein LOC106128313 [Papilio xuthus]